MHANNYNIYYIYIYIYIICRSRERESSQYYQVCPLQITSICVPCVCPNVDNDGLCSFDMAFSIILNLSMHNFNTLCLQTTDQEIGKWSGDWN